MSQTPPTLPQFNLLPTYCAYLVRLWQEQPEGPWRASAQSARTGKKVYFANLDALFAFLQAQTLARPPRPDE